MKLSNKEIERRLEYVEEVEALGVDVNVAHLIEDFGTFELFKYEVQSLVLESAGVTIAHLPQTADSKPTDHRRMDNLFMSHFKQAHVNTDALFSECSNVRDKIARLTTLTESELVMVYDNLSVEYTVRKYAEAMLSGGIDDMHKILDQSLGKPLEQRVTEHREVSALLGMTTPELKALLEENPDDQVEIEIEDI